MRHVLLVVACAAMLVGLHLTSTAGAQGQAAQRERWEYATLTSTHNQDGTVTTTFATRQQVVEGSMRQVADKLGGFNPASHRSSWTALVNVLGDQGWELVAIDPPAGPAGSTYVFKRRLP